MILATAPITTGATVARREHAGEWRIVIEFHGGKGYGLRWQQADELARRIRAALESMSLDANAIRIDMPGATYIVPSTGARSVQVALVAKARECEEQEQAEGVALDQAIVTRAGAPFGLSSDRKINAEAAKLAQWDPYLRKCIPGGVRSKFSHVLGAPTIINHAHRGAKP